MRIYLVVLLCLAISTPAMATQGTWMSSAGGGTGKLTDTDSQSAWVTAARSGPASLVTGLEWTKTANSIDPDTKSVDYSSTVGSGAGAYWNINDNSGTTYNKMYITPASFDNSRGIVMARIKVNNCSSVNGTFGFSLGDMGKGMNLAVRDGTLRVRTADGDNLGSAVGGWGDPTLDTKSDYRVYALSWSSGIANVWYSNGNDWSGDSANWTQIVDNYAMVDGVGLTTTGAQISGIVLFDAGSANTWNGNIQWIAHSTYDNINGEMTPWDSGPPTPMSPEPGGIVALCGGMAGLVGFARKRLA